jgi:abortive infection bacteriophage resistance protein
MKYQKPPLSIQQQIEKLKQRGLIFHDEEKAAHYLSNISYYRLRAYTYPFQDNHDPNHPFNQAVSFDDIIDIYVFDRRLRLLVFNSIEKIEIALLQTCPLADCKEMRFPEKWKEEEIWN